MLHPIIDPRAGDLEDDASSTKSKKLTTLAGSMLAEISLPKLVVAWLLLIALPGLLLGLAPLVASAWLKTVTNKLVAFSGIGSLALLLILVAVAWYGLRPLFRFVERSFWALHALAVQPVYALCREGLSHLAEGFLEPGADEQRRAHRRAVMAAVAGLLACAFAAVFVIAVWPYTRWTATWDAFSAPTQLIWPALANAVAMVGTYLAVASLVWGIGDAMMDQPGKLTAFDEPAPSARLWRVAHLSDLHTVGERYGFRLECGRLGPRGNGRLARVFEQLDAIHQTKPIDVVMVSGDMTDAGRSSEWAEFLEAVGRFPALAERTLILPGNHDLNVVDRANPARLELPTSPQKQLRTLRTLSAMELVQGRRAHVCDRASGRIGPTLTEALAPHRELIVSFADGSRRVASPRLSHLWADCFPQIVPPDGDSGIGVIILNSNAQSNFSFTNALGLVTAAEVHDMRRIMAHYPKAGWIVALHHHLMEYPMAVKAFSERIGTALINGSWFVRVLKPVADRIVMMHGHRHIDWIGRVGSLTVVSAPSPVMEARDSDSTCFYIHTIGVQPDGRLALAKPERIEIAGVSADSSLSNSS